MARKKQKSNKGLLILILVAVVVIVVIVAIPKGKNKENSNNEKQVTIDESESGIRVNSSEELQKEKTFFGYQISKASLSEFEGETTFSAKLKNVTDKVIGNESLYIVFKSTTGAELYKMQIYVTEIEPEKTVEINSVITKDIVESYEIEIVK